MIFAGGNILPDSERNPVPGRLGEEISRTLSGPPLAAETVLDALEALGSELDSGALDGLIAQYAPPGAREELDRVRPQISRKTLESGPWGYCSTSRRETWRGCPPSPPWRACSPAISTW